MSDVRVIVTGIPFRLYRTVYSVPELNPFSVIAPLEAPHASGETEVKVITGITFTFTSIPDRGPSHPAADVWLTYQETVPAVAVEGTGAPDKGVPPVAVVYQFSCFPVSVAVSGNAWASRQ